MLKLDGDTVSVGTSPCRFIYEAKANDWWCVVCQARHYIPEDCRINAVVTRRTWLNRMKAKRMERLMAADATHHSGHIVKSYLEWKSADLARARKELIR